MSRFCFFAVFLALAGIMFWLNHPYPAGFLFAAAFAAPILMKPPHQT